MVAAGDSTVSRHRNLELVILLFNVCKVSSLIVAKSETNVETNVHPKFHFAKIHTYS